MFVTYVVNIIQFLLHVLADIKTVENHLIHDDISKQPLILDASVLTFLG